MPNFIRLDFFSRNSFELPNYWFL